MSAVSSLDRRMRRVIERECRREARELMLIQYERYDAIWWNRIRITPALYDHGQDTVRDINKIMPNLLTHDPFCSPVDIVAEQFDFASTSDLVEYLLAYSPRGPVESRIYESLLAERFCSFPTEGTATGTDDVPSNLKRRIS